MLTRTDIRIAVNNFIKSAEEIGLDIQGILLFGSYAKGLQKKYSDIDLAVFSKDFTDNPFENIKKIQGTNRIPQMSLKLYTMEDFFNDPFVQEIKSHAITLFSRNPQVVNQTHPA